MTDRLYYSDPNLLEFDAVVVESRSTGEGVETRLDRSAFYPASGGQPHDTGLLGQAKVIKVAEDGQGAVWHVTDKVVGTTGARVHGVVDPMRRRRHCQMHTAQHILSSIFADFYAAETVSVHMGEAYGAVELSIPMLAEEQLRQVEDRANEYLNRNLAIDILFVDAGEAARLPLRKHPTREGLLRLIKIGEIDYSACGGTHCNSSAEVGMIKIVGIEKQRGNLLVRFLSGLQALEDYRRCFEVSDRLAHSLTCAVTELPGNVDKLIHQNKYLKKQLAQLQRQILPLKAEELLRKARAVGSTRLVVEDLTDTDSSLAGTLATEVAQAISGLAVLVIESRLVIASAATSGVHAGELLKKLAEKTSLRGGGSERLAQAGGASIERLEDYTAILEKLLRDA